MSPLTLQPKTSRHKPLATSKWAAVPAMRRRFWGKDRAYVRIFSPSAAPSCVVTLGCASLVTARLRLVDIGYRLRLDVASPCASLWFALGCLAAWVACLAVPGIWAALGCASLNRVTLGGPWLNGVHLARLAEWLRRWESSLLLVALGGARSWFSALGGARYMVRSGGASRTWFFARRCLLWFHRQCLAMGSNIL